MYDVERDMAKMSKRLQSGELFQDPPSRPEAPRSAELQQNKQTAAEGCSFSESIKNHMFVFFFKVFAPIAASISRKRADCCGALRFLRIKRRAHQDSNAIGHDAGRMAQRAPRKNVQKNVCLVVFQLVFSSVPKNDLDT